MRSWPARIQRLVYFGTPQPAVPPLRALCAAGFEVALVVTGPDRRRRRRGPLEPSAVSRAATELGIPVAHSPAAALALAGEVDGAVVVAYGRLIGADVLRLLPAVNVHFSLLPRWRGAAPVEHAILAGDETTGVSLMALEETLDTGPVHAQAQTPVHPDETADELRKRLVELACPLLTGALEDGLGPPEPQQGEVTWAPKLTVEDLHLDWSRTAVELHRLVRLGRAWTTLDGERLQVLRAEVVAAEHTAPPGQLDDLAVGTAAGELHLQEVQAAGRRPMPAADWRRGLRARPEGPTTLGT